MTRFLVIRHGETDWNVRGRWQGHTDVPLNDLGRQQATWLAERLRQDGVKIDYIWTSDLMRAFYTALEVGKALDVPVMWTAALREINLGDWSGLTKEEVIAKDGETLTRIEAGEDLPRGGRGETMAQVTARVGRMIETMADEHPRATIGIFTHGAAMRALFSHIAHLAGVPAPHGMITNTSITEIEYIAGVWRFIRYNDAAHLRGTEHPPGTQPAGDQAAVKP